MIIAKHLKNFFRRRIIEKSISYQALKNQQNPQPKQLRH